MASAIRVDGKVRDGLGQDLSARLAFPSPNFLEARTVDGHTAKLGRPVKGEFAQVAAHHFETCLGLPRFVERRTEERERRRVGRRPTPTDPSAAQHRDSPVCAWS